MNEGYGGYDSPEEEEHHYFRDHNYDHRQEDARKELAGCFTAVGWTLGLGFLVFVVIVIWRVYL